MRIGYGLVLALFATAALAQDIKVDGPKAAPQGSLVKLHIILEEGESGVYMPVTPADLDNFVCDSHFVFAMPAQDTAILILAQKIKDNMIVTRQLRYEVHLPNTVTTTTQYFQTFAQTHAKNLPHKQELAKTFEQLIPTIPNYSSEQAFLESVQKATNLTLGEHRPAWADFSTRLQTEMNGQNVTLATVGQVLKGLSQGLK